MKVNPRLEEHIASIFRVEEQAKQETSVKQILSSAELATCLTQFWTLRAS
jgi:hypothetical protein